MMSDRLEASRSWLLLFTLTSLSAGRAAGAGGGCSAGGVVLEMACASCSKKCTQPDSHSSLLTFPFALAHCCVSASSSLAAFTSFTARSASSQTCRTLSASRATPELLESSAKPPWALAATALSSCTLASASSSETVCAALTLVRSSSASALRSRSGCEAASSTKAWATKSSSERARPPHSAIVSWSALPLSSSSLSSESGSTTALAPERDVPRFMKFPTARQVLAHFRSSSELRRAWQQTPTFWNASLSSLSSRAGPASRAPQASFGTEVGELARTQRYLSGMSSWESPAGGMFSCRS
mmetsp:Transcript_101954/g.297335  ORF Transcript_101954/g.297335 Transcript_101954/m.297335 type:complete len:299 (-) Transcript_101954:493-1389(-)